MTATMQGPQAARDDLIASLIVERHQPMPKPASERTDIVQKLDPSDTELNCGKRQTELLRALEGFIYTPQSERKKAKITNHLRAVKKAA